MRALPLLLLLVGACASHAAEHPVTPMNEGPTVQATRAADGGLDFAMTVPTGGHELVVGGVAVRGEVAEVRLLHITPGNAIVTQMVSTVHAHVEATRLGAAQQLEVWVATRARDDSVPGSEPALALRLQRP